MKKYLDISLYIRDYLVDTENFVKQYIYSFRPVITIYEKNLVFFFTCEQFYKAKV